MPQLLERTGPNQGRMHAIPEGRHVLGRDRSASVVLEGPDVSRRHAQLDVSPAGVVVRDLESKNGVRVDGVTLRGARLLVHGDTLCVGGIELEVIHPSSQVGDALARAGETTVTRALERPSPDPPARSLFLPILGVVLFAVLVTLMLSL
jgi:pSer/pThr/pTyr-binding forkhead associated (FHA) protein